MSYGFAGYPCHSSQLTLMTGNLNSSVTNSPCCPVTESQSSNTSTNTASMNGTVSDSPPSEPPVPSAPMTHQLPPTSSMCTLTSPYESRLINSYPRLGSFYGSSYSDQNSFYPSGTFYSSFGHPYDLKDANPGGWTGLPQATCYPYDPTLYNPYSDRYSAMDSAARRKNATRETTNTLKAWLYEHRKNPYPTKGEKIMLAIITKMTLTQVSTWFANARRRLKKENKMTWEPRNKNGDGHDTDDKESCKDSEDNSSSGNADNHCSNENKLSVKKELKIGCDKTKAMSEVSQGKNNLETAYPTRENQENNNIHADQNGKTLSILGSQGNGQNENQVLNHHIKHDAGAGGEVDSVTSSLDSLGQRPKIWSLAQTATSESPPFAGRSVAAVMTEWSSTLPQGPDAVLGLSDYQQREYPQPPPSGLSTGTLRRGPTAIWPEEHNLGPSRSAAMQLLTTGSIGTGGYLQTSKSCNSNAQFASSSHHHHHPFPNSMQHLIHANHHEASTLSSGCNFSANSLKPIIDSHPYHNLSMEVNENRVSNGLSYNNSNNAKSSNTFLGKVFPEYISSGPDALSLTDNASDRGGSNLSVEDSTPSPSSSSPNLDLNNTNNIINKNHSNNNNYGLSAFRPMLKR